MLAWSVPISVWGRTAPICMAPPWISGFRGRRSAPPKPETQNSKLALLRGAEARQRRALAGVVEHELDGLAYLDRLHIAVHDVGHDPRALGQLHVRQHVRDRLPGLRQVTRAFPVAQHLFD